MDMIKYPAYAKELRDLLERDQEQWRSFWRDNFEDQDKPDFAAKFNKIRRQQQSRSERMLQILDEIHEPSLSNVGAEAAQAVSVLALHDSLSILRRVLDAFTRCYERDKDDTYYQAIPSMTDRVRLLERKPQKFGTQWNFDENGYPFLPTVEDFEHVNERRALYGIELLRWPRSLALPESKQPWLKRPVTELVMRDMTDAEYERMSRDYA